MITFLTIISILMLSFGLSMDSLALAVSCGLQTNPHQKWLDLKIPIIFAFVQTLIQLIGYLLGSAFANLIESFAHWVAFGLLLYIGLNMIKEALENKSEDEQEEKELTIWMIFTMAIAASIDELAAGVSMRATSFPLVLTLILIFIITFIISFLGYYLGSKVGTNFQRHAEIFGGVVLIALGIKILLEHFFSH